MFTPSNLAQSMIGCNTTTVVAYNNRDSEEVGYDDDVIHRSAHRLSRTAIAFWPVVAFWAVW